MPAPGRSNLRTTYPGKAILGTLHILFNAARLPIWLLAFIPKGLRQDRRWSWRQALGVRIFRALIVGASQVEVSTPTSLTPGAEKDQWVTLDPAPSKYYQGITLADPEIKPTKIGGTWYPSPPAGAQLKQVILHFHGGAFVVGDGRKKDTEFCCNTLKKNSGISHVFSVQYRLSSNAGGRFPAALQDAITAYTYLLHGLGFSSDQIIVTGDSAGGNLTLSLLRYIADHGKELDLPSPKAAWLWSPWVDPQGVVREKGVVAGNRHNSTDFLSDNFVVWGAECYTPAKSTGLTNDSEYINFLAHPFKTDVPLYFSICENECLFDDDTKAYEKFSAIAGNKTAVSIEDYAPHDIVLVGEITGFQKEAAEAVRKAGKWLSSL